MSVKGNLEDLYKNFEKDWDLLIPPPPPPPPLSNTIR